MSIHDPEFATRYAGRYYGKYRALVVSTDDPRQLHRLMVKVPAVFGMDEVLGWAWPMPPAGGSENNGEVIPVEVEDLVLVEFEEGDPSSVYWRPGPWPVRGGESTFPDHARGESNDTDYSTRDYRNVPPSQFAGQYNNVRFIQDKRGNLLELDATVGEERVQLAHRSGSRIEMTSDGGFQQVANAGMAQRVEDTLDIEIGGDAYTVIGGAKRVEVGKESEEIYQGNRQETYSQRAITGKRMVQTWEGAFDLGCGGPLKLRSYGNLALNSANQIQLTSGHDLVATVMETLDISSSGTTRGQASAVPSPGAVVSNIRAINGINQLVANDITGEVVELLVQLDPLISNPKIHLEAGSVGGKIDLLMTPLANVHLGGATASEFLVKGTTFMTQLQLVMAGLTALGANLSAVPVTKAAGDALTAVMASWNINSAASVNFLSTSVATK